MRGAHQETAQASCGILAASEWPRARCVGDVPV